MESHAHLFFDCQFSSSIWQQILSRNGITRSILPLSHELEWAVHYIKGKGLRNSLYKLSLAASIYHIWGERNLRFFQGKSRDVATVSLTIFNSIQAKANSWATVKLSAQN
ncbi:hypothetical protein RHMOL_Rhmol04G0242700 [Rhododendron molle]|uniref:Uncharacterized protein n=1 Tax=Rhododendron molle TaxID=49168 RepID=A0ACC0P6C0_RHOML|nr:hypothetical protein RHMOL_Rhmol04G0242700 [Rhododendron molle]